MTTLQTLADKQDLILLAEIAALLHNIGKLDPNFLAEKVRDKPTAQQELEEYLSDIPNYYFDRFAAPDANLLARARKVISGQKWGSRAELASALEREFEDPADRAAVHALSQNWTEAKKDHPFTAQVIEAAWRFNMFQHGNGPLYGCLMQQRQAAGQTLKEIEKGLESTKRELEKVRRDLDMAAPGEKKPLGLRKGELEAQIAKLEQEQKQVWGTVFSTEREQQAQLEAQFRSFVVDVAGESWPLADLLTLFWDDFFYQPPGDPDSGYNSGYKRRSVLGHWLNPQQGTMLPAVLILSHGEVSGAEKPEQEMLEKPPWEHLRFATAFGYERDDLDKWTLHDARHQLIASALQACADPSKERNGFVDTAREILEMGLGDTQWPINEINLWDYTSTIAALFKSGVARAVLEGKIPTVGDMRWRFLSLRFDGLGYLSQAHHVTDLLGRRKIVTAALNAAQRLLEVTYPLGNEVYRDENGIVFVVPDLPDQDILDLTKGTDETLKTLLGRAFAEAEEKDEEGKNKSSALAGELTPNLRESPGMLGKRLRLGQYLRDEALQLTADVEKMAAWWTKGQRPPNAEICTVCGMRPVGYPAKGSPHEQDLQLEPWADQDKAEDRNVCRVCLQRRGRRAWDWTRNKKTAEEKLGPFERTIWTDEVADDYGRFALVVGRFVLDGWLDGKLIPTMRKSASFARVRRCWETTRQFWLEVQDEELPKCVGQRLRLGLRPVNVEAINHRDPKKGLGRWHTYEADVGGCRLGLCWDPNDKDTDDRNLFWTTDNLRYLGRQPNFEQKALKADNDMAAEWLQWLDGHTLPLYEPGGYLGQERRANVDAEDCVVVKQEHFHPFVPLMTEPATFMALVPADKALAVAQVIKAKYDTEMARVRDRLPLHLGLVFAPRRTPLAAVLEAGRAMLKMPDDWEAWQIISQEITEKTLDDGRQVPEKAALGLRPLRQESKPSAEQPLPDDSPSDDGTARVTWHYPLLMGDGQTPDLWYPHLVSHELDKRLEEKKELLPEGKEPELTKQDGDFAFISEATGTVYVRPSRFDFEFLDTTARRFEIHYDENGRRPRRTRPFLLDDLGRLETLWIELRYLEKSQRHQVIATIEATREAWFGADRKGQSLTDGVFHQFVRDTLAGAAWPERRRWKDICQAKTDKQLVTAGVAGELADLAELHMEILKE